MTPEDKKSLTEIADLFTRNSDALSISLERGVAAHIAASLNRIASLDEPIIRPPLGDYVFEAYRGEIDLAMKVQACAEADAELRRITGEWLRMLF